jgi:hypothetical protein
VGWRDLLPQSSKTDDRRTFETPKKSNTAHIADIALQEDKLSPIYIDKSSTQSPPIGAKSAQSAESIQSPTPSKIPIAPLQPGWLVVYRDAHGELSGGCLDRAHGTVEGCEWDGSRWTVSLTDGTKIPLRIILAVAETEHTGQVIAAWTVRDHGYDGKQGQEATDVGNDRS